MYKLQGSANSRAEGVMAGFIFKEDVSVLRIFPLYVKNRDPRINYQPAVLGGASGRGILLNFAAISGESGTRLKIAGGVGEIECQDHPRH
jgi:hypothetical protein